MRQDYYFHITARKLGSAVLKLLHASESSNKEFIHHLGIDWERVCISKFPGDTDASCLGTTLKITSLC